MLQSRLDNAAHPVRQAEVSEKAVKDKYVFIAPWRVQAGTGVNNVMVGLSDAMRGEYEPIIVVTDWSEAVAGQISVKMPEPRLPIRNFLGFVLRLVPNSIRLWRLTRGAAVVNAHYFGTSIVPLVWLRKLRLAPKLIFSVHGADVTAALQAGWLEKKLYRWIYGSADVIIACSDALGKLVSEVSPGSNVKTVWNGVIGPPAQVGHRPMAPPYLVSVAAFVPKKAHDVVLRAFREIYQGFPDLRLVMIGSDGPERNRVGELIVDLGLETRVDVHVDVPHEEVWTWVRHAECFVHAPWEEPFGIAILEAALVRTPVVVTAVGGVPEFLRDGVDGLTCEPGRPDQLSEKVRNVLTHRQQAERRAMAFYEKALKFTWSAAWEKYKGVSGLG